MFCDPLAELLAFWISSVCKKIWFRFFSIKHVILKKGMAPFEMVTASSLSQYSWVFYLIFHLGVVVMSTYSFLIGWLIEIVF